MWQLFTKTIFLSVLIGLGMFHFGPAGRKADEALTGNDGMWKKTARKNVPARHPANSITYKKSIGYSQSARIVERSQTEPQNFEDIPGPIGKRGQSYIPMETYSNGNFRSNASGSARPSTAKQNDSRKVRAGEALVNAPIWSPTNETPLVKPPEEKKSVNSGEREILTCSASKGGGVYSDSQIISISCSGASEIKYCVSEGSCCDPNSGASYSGPISIGASGKQFCLSFYGNSATGDDSEIIEHNFVFNAFVPDLGTEVAKVQYQTTELPGKSAISSDDFSKTGFGIGLINMKSHNAGALTCTEIVENHTDYTAPAPVVILSFFDTSGVPVSSLVEVPLTQNHLDYGDNFLTSYIQDSTNPQIEYACSTNKITLRDFEFFNGDIAHADVNVSQVAEFSAGFNPYGFFETDETLYRGPAGESSQESTGQILESGLFSVLY